MQIRWLVWLNFRFMRWCSALSDTITFCFAMFHGIRAYEDVSQWGNGDDETVCEMIWPTTSGPLPLRLESPGCCVHGLDIPFGVLRPSDALAAHQEMLLQTAALSGFRVGG